MIIYRIDFLLSKRSELNEYISGCFLGTDYADLASLKTSFDYAKE